MYYLPMQPRKDQVVGVWALRNVLFLCVRTKQEKKRVAKQVSSVQSSV